MLSSLSKHISAEETRPYIEKGLEGSNVNEQRAKWKQCKKGIVDHMPIIWIIFPVTGEHFMPQILNEHLYEENSLCRYYELQKIKD